jgi:hypothetical protein
MSSKTQHEAPIAIDLTEDSDDITEPGELRKSQRIKAQWSKKAIKPKVVVKAIKSEMCEPFGLTELTESTEAPKSTDMSDLSKTMNISDFSKMTEMIKMLEMPEILKTAEMSDISEMSDIFSDNMVGISDTIAVPDMIVMSELTELTEITKIIEMIDIPKIPEMSVMPSADNISEVSETPEMSEPEIPEKSEIPKIVVSEVSEIPKTLETPTVIEMSTTSNTPIVIEISRISKKVPEPAKTIIEQHKVPDPIKMDCCIPNLKYLASSPNLKIKNISLGFQNNQSVIIETPTTRLAPANSETPFTLLKPSLRPKIDPSKRVTFNIDKDKIHNVKKVNYGHKVIRHGKKVDAM